MQTTIQPTAAWISRVTALLHSGDRGPAAIARFLPPPHDPDYSRALSHLVKADLRSLRGGDRSSAWATYRSHFPDLPVNEPTEDVCAAITALRPNDPDLSRTPAPSILKTRAVRIEPLEVVDVASPRSMPKAGQEFGNYTIVDELGRGAFGRVYLATEHNLANRLVALKVTRKANRESQKLARLQHTNIVPIHSAFRNDGWHVVQMPFFGRQTLADLVETVRAEKTFPNVSRDVFASTQMRASTSRKSHHSSQPASVDDSQSQRVPLEALTADERQPARELLAGLNYTDAAIWIVARLADGLAHAHAKGILHLDLKPHNVLLSDEGQPMLLDFNLAFDVSRAERDRVGGTWPYMSPEQIGEYARRPGMTVDARSDLYALGVIFYELLTLQHPFPMVQTTDAGLTAAIVARQAGAPDVRRLNPNVPASIAAVVARLLANDPAGRYQSADELREDLRHHVENRPLVHAPDRSPRERILKWHRRNPRLSLVACIVVLGCGLAFTAAQMMAWAKDRDTVAAKEKAASFQADLSGLRLDLASVNDTARREKALQKATDWLRDYRVASNAAWADAAAIRLLPADRRADVTSGLGELALLAAHAEWLTGRSRPESEKYVFFERALALNATARAVFGERSPAAATFQHKELNGESVTPETELSDDATDLFARAMRLVAVGRHKDASTLLVKLTTLSPDHFAGQFALGFCYEHLGQWQRAMERYQIAKPLASHDARPSYQRGMLLFFHGNYEDAEVEFSNGLERDPAMPDLHLRRALVRKHRNELRAALEDLNAEIALERGSRIIALAIRAEVHDRLGEASAAKADRDALDRCQPSTALEFVARASRWLASEPAKALSDYNEALKLDPSCFAALQNKASVYADRLHENERALPLMKQAAAVYPGFGLARAGHAVVLARLGQRAEAHAEIEAALLLIIDPEVVYQAACVYSLTSAQEPKDRATALGLFRRCFRDGYRKWSIIDNDPDLNNIRNDEEFQTILKAARELVK